MGGFGKVARFGLASTGLLLAWLVLAVALIQPAKADGAPTYGQVSEGLFDKVSSGHMAAVSPQRGQ